MRGREPHGERGTGGSTSWEVMALRQRFAGHSRSILPGMIWMIACVYVCVGGGGSEGRKESRVTPKFLEDGGATTEKGRRARSRLDRGCLVGASAQCGTL